MKTRLQTSAIWLAVLCAAALIGWPARAAEMRVRPDLITPQAEAAIQKALAHLARTQARDGSWRAGGGAMGAMGQYPCAMTSLGGLALMAGGNTPHQGPYAANVRRAVDYVLGCAGPTGLIGKLDDEGARPMYAHGFGMLFLAQAYGMETDQVRQQQIAKVLRRAVQLTGQAQSPAGGWLYTPDANSDEGSVTITQIQGLRACRNAGIKVPKEIIDRATKYIANCANADGGISYSLSSRGASRPAITAAAVAVLYNSGSYDDPVAAKALDYLRKLGGGKGAGAGIMGHYFYHNLYMSQAMWLSSEANWKEWFPKMRDEIVGKQQPNGGWMGDSVGEVYGTSLALLILQLPYQYLPILQR
jgi:hypothetical protein